MSFDSLEKDSEQGLPARAYKFTLGETVWRFVSGDRDLVVGGETWKASAISDEGVKLSGDNTVDALTITASAEIGPARLFRDTPPSLPVHVTIYNYHRADNQFMVEYVGTISQVDPIQPGTSTITCEMLFASTERDGLRLCWQRACPYALYDARTCGVNKAAYGVEVDLLTADNGLATGAAFASKPSGYFNGGFLTWLHPVRGTEFRAIEEHTADQVKMFGYTDGMYYGLRVTAYPGCNRTPDHCQNRFNNWGNYGGCPDLDGTNPFDGNPVF